MRTAAFDAVHGNLPALEAVRAEVERANVDAIVSRGEVVCHGSPRGDGVPLMRVTLDARPAQAVAGVDQADVVCGHTPARFDRMSGAGRLGNAGNVGLPSVGAAAARLVASGLPGAEPRRLPALVEPARPDEVGRLFEGGARGGA